MKYLIFSEYGNKIALFIENMPMVKYLFLKISKQKIESVHVYIHIIHELIWEFTVLNSKNIFTANLK